MTRLPLYQEILLLALDDDKGTTDFGGMYTNAMAGSILAELAMDGAIRISADKNKTVTPVRGASTSDPILAEALTLITEAKKPKKARDWVMKFAGLKDFKNRAARQLVDRGVLKEDTGSVLKIFSRTIYPERDGGPERDLIERMRKAIFTETREVEQRTVVIVALTQATGMLGKIFEKKKLKERKKRLEKLSSGQLAGAATKEAVEAIQAAILVCTMVPVITTAT